MRGITRRRLLGEAGLGVAALTLGAASFAPAAEAMAAPLPAGYLHTRGAQILDARNKPVRLAGVSWYGFESTSRVPGGLNSRTLDSSASRFGIWASTSSGSRTPYRPCGPIRQTKTISKLTPGCGGGRCSRSWTR
jgi:hypothetical protein